MLFYPNLFTPLQLRGVSYRNRIFSAPMTFRDLDGNGNITAEAAAFYEHRAKGGAAEVIVSELTINGQYGRTYPNNTSADTPFVKVGLAVAADGIKRQGAVPSVELNHGGKYAVTPELWGPVDCMLHDGRRVIAMDKTMINTVIDEFARSAALAKAAGYRSVFIHGGHGWLLHQFFSPADNSRTDEYGGSLKNRARLTLEVLEAVRSAVGDEMPIELRLSADEYRAGGYTLKELIELAIMVEGKADLLHISTGSHENSFDQTHQTMFVPRGGLVKFAAAVKERVSTPVAAIGAISEPEMAEHILSSGQADVVVMARQLLADPYWPRKAMAGKPDSIVSCCRCFTCQGERMISGLRMCALNPKIGRETLVDTLPAAKAKNVLVVGGGPAGITAAITAAQRGHNVTLYEKEQDLGGALKEERAISFKQDLYRWIEVKARELSQTGVRVITGVMMTPELAADMNVDVIFAATGTKPLLPNIPGIEKTVPAGALGELQIAPSSKIVVIGGGLVGLETAYELSLRGHSVTVLEMGSKPAKDANARHGPMLIERLEKVAQLSLNTVAIRVDDKGVWCRKDDKEVFIPADVVICAAGRVPLYEQAVSFRGCAEEVFEIGDCYYQGGMAAATARAYTAAMDI